MLFPNDYNAPKNKFRVIGVDIFYGGEWIEDEFNNLPEAIKYVKEKSDRLTKLYVYNDKGDCVHDSI